MADARRWADDRADLTDRERETAADKRLYVEIGLVPVACQACGAEVAVKKNSQKHTSVQWTLAAVDRCAEFAAARAEGRPSAVLLGCSRLKASIEDAVRAGAVVVPED